MSKLKIGIIFGGRSKEREISFAGGRTVYDNLDKSIFEPIALFVDSFGNFVHLDWQFVYKGTIRDFYPPVSFIPASNSHFQLYAENLGELSKKQQTELTQSLGKTIAIDELNEYIDFAFLCLHGPLGEDGSIQGMFEYLNIPYSGSGILPSSIGINKPIQKLLMLKAGFNSPAFFVIQRSEYLKGNCKTAFTKAKAEIGFPMVIKPANQGSSIGVSILYEDNDQSFMNAVEKALFTRWLSVKDWNSWNDAEKFEYVRSLADIREGIGMPIKINEVQIHDPNHLIRFLNEDTENKDGWVIESLDAEEEVLIEAFIQGKEFSCIVVEDEEGKAIALPPTEIRKGKELFDYRSKYLPGLSRKITPIEENEEVINLIRKECERLFYSLHFDVYARIDGFLSHDGKIYLNDPNTTSGMMPSSFFFHQAAEIGLSPSQFLSFIIRASLKSRSKKTNYSSICSALLKHLDAYLNNKNSKVAHKKRVAVILGGYSSERHISVESGRNIYEKLASSEKYVPFPVFLSGNSEQHLLFQLPINVLLKDNADDIKEKIDHWTIHPVVKAIIQSAEHITEKYGNTDNLIRPLLLSYNDLKDKCDEVFIALHGRPGEDGAVQEKLDALGIPYNGSGKESSSITIDKYHTNEILLKNGLLVAKHRLIDSEEWATNKTNVIEDIQKNYGFPFIAKPVDDGCSSAVKKIKSVEELEAFTALIFRKNEELDAKASEILHIKPKEEFPIKNCILIEELISKKDAMHFLEITGGMLTHFNANGELEYEVFEASEALAEGDILSLEEKFLAGQGQNITPARYAKDPSVRAKISNEVKAQLAKAAKLLGVAGYCRIDAFVRIFENGKVEVIFIEVNSLPGMTPATCIYHQAAINGYKPYDFIDRILDFGEKRKALA